VKWDQVKIFKKIPCGLKDVGEQPTTRFCSKCYNITIVNFCPSSMLTRKAEAVQTIGTSMTDLNQKIAHAEKHCQAQGVRLTQKRKQVLSGLLQSEKALSAYELIDLYKEKFDESLPAMSAYRILEFLQTENLVHKLNLANKYVACAHIACDHAHEVPQFLICSECQRVEEITIKRTTVDDLHANVTAAGFHLVSPQIEINCICDQCKNH